MLDNRPLSEQEYADVDAYLQQRIGENLTLDYKRELSISSDRDRAELCKDVSALANSQGGMIIYGVDEDSTDRTPLLPPFGTPRTVGRQSVEEWVSQVLRSGVQPPLDFEIEAFDYGGGPDRCVLVVRTNASPSAPHMVTLKADNRYYGRFYRRSNYESTRLLLGLVVGAVVLFLIYLLLNSLLTVKKVVGVASDGTEMKERIIGGFVYTPNAKRRIRREGVGFDRFFSGVQYREREVWKGWSIALSKVVFVFVYICMVTCGTLALVTIAFLISFQI